MLKIVKTPDPTLTSQAQKVEKFDTELIKLVNEMEKTLDAQLNPQGVGLAAPQIGRGIALFIIKPKPKSKTEVFINPRIIKQTIDDRSLKLDIEDRSSKRKQNPGSSVQSPSSKKKRTLEGCLSIGKIWGPVNRAPKVRIEYQDITGKTHKKWLSGFKSVIVQHEIDHLHGVLFTQRVLEQKGQLFEEKDGVLEKLTY